MRIVKSLEHSLVRAVLAGGKVLTTPPLVPEKSKTVRNWRRISTLMRTAATSFLISLALLLPVEAANFEVNTLNDAGPGSLRQAITDANASGDNDAIQISVQGSILLATELPALLGTTVITGPGASRLFISPAPNGPFQGPIFIVDSAAIISINGVTVEKCQNGAVQNSGTLTLERCVLNGNQNPLAGGGIRNFGNLVVRRSTLSGNVAKGVLGSNSGTALGGAIWNIENAHLSVVSSTISGNRAVGADGVSGDFLIRKDSGGPNQADQLDSDLYYAVVDPNSTRLTLGAWRQTNGFNGDGTAPGGANAAYLNNGDLGFGRDMHMLQREINGVTNVAACVSNYSLNLDHSPDQNPLSADAAQAREFTQSIATVCMEYSAIDTRPPAERIVKFFVYDGVKANAVRVGAADLDGNGPKFTPQLCMVCHGGTPPPHHGETLTTVLNMNSHFREFDLASFKFPRPGTRVDDPSRSVPTLAEEASFKSLNQRVLATDPPPAIEELITGWYGGSGLPLATQDQDFVPLGWNAQAQLYRDVVATSCRTCHVAQGIDFSSYTGFANFRYTIEAEVLHAATKAMPHAKVAFGNFWRAGRQTTLANFEHLPEWPKIGTGNITGSPAGSGLGGGIFSRRGFNQPVLDIVTSTIAQNTAATGVGIGNITASGGGIASGNNSTSLGNTLIANNFIHDLPAFAAQDINGSVNSIGFNLLGTTSGTTILPQPSDLIDIADPKIVPLALRLFTLTPSHILRYDSPALDKGSAATDPSSGLPITTDQRGNRRPADDPNIPNAPGGDGSDIGAYERGVSRFPNLSTRAEVLSGSSVLILGVIIVGDTAKNVIIRAGGPSLAASGVPNALADPVLELHGPSGFATITNNNWRDTQEAEIIATGIPPTNDLEPAIVATLAPGAYTAIVQGVNGGTGVGIVEVYNLADESILANISTRGFVGTGDDVMIGGMIVQGGDPLPVIVRAIGPSLALPEALGDPTLDLYDGNGALVAANDNWRSDQEADLIATSIPPSNDLESAIVRELAPGNYTAIVRGVNNTTGVALVEAYDLN